MLTDISSLHAHQPTESEVMMVRKNLQFNIIWQQVKHLIIDTTQEHVTIIFRCEQLITAIAVFPYGYEYVLRMVIRMGRVGRQHHRVGAGQNM